MHCASHASAHHGAPSSPQVRELVVDAQRLAAVVTYRERESAEVACAALNGCLTVRGSRCRVMWARKRGGGSGGGGGGAEAGAMRVHDHYGEGAVSGGGGPPPPPPPPPTGIAVSYGSRGRGVANTPTMWLPPGVRPAPGTRPPPGIKRAATGSAAVYPSMDPNRTGARPEA